MKKNLAEKKKGFLFVLESRHVSNLGRKIENKKFLTGVPIVLFFFLYLIIYFENTPHSEVSVNSSPNPTRPQRRST